MEIFIFSMTVMVLSVHIGQNLSHRVVKSYAAFCMLFLPQEDY